MESKKIISDHNKELLKSLLPDKITPIYGNSFTNPNEPIFEKSFEQIKNEVLNDFLDEHEFLTEFEQIKHNLKID